MLVYDGKESNTEHQSKINKQAKKKQIPFYRDFFNDEKYFGNYNKKKAEKVHISIG